MQFGKTVIRNAHTHTQLHHTHAEAFYSETIVRRSSLGSFVRVSIVAIVWSNSTHCACCEIHFMFIFSDTARSFVCLTLRLSVCINRFHGFHICYWLAKCFDDNNFDVCVWSSNLNILLLGHLNFHKKLSIDVWYVNDETRTRLNQKMHMSVNSVTSNRTIDIHLECNVPIIVSKPIRVG